MRTSGVADLTGRVLAGRYRLVAPLGTGASGRVYAAWDVRLQRKVAVKVLHAALADDAGFLRRFGAEAQMAASLHHPNVVGVYDWGEDETPFMVLELLEGGSLRSILDRGDRLSPAQAAAVGRQIAAGLDYAHVRGLVHRDVKPANLLFDEHGTARVADFGLARALAEASWTEPAGRRARHRPLRRPRAGPGHRRRPVRRLLPGPRAGRGGDRDGAVRRRHVVDHAAGPGRAPPRGAARARRPRPRAGAGRPGRPCRALSRRPVLRRRPGRRRRASAGARRHPAPGPGAVDFDPHPTEIRSVPGLRRPLAVGPAVVAAGRLRLPRGGGVRRKRCAGRAAGGDPGLRPGADRPAPAPAAKRPRPGWRPQRVVPIVVLVVLLVAAGTAAFAAASATGPRVRVPNLVGISERARREAAKQAAGEGRAPAPSPVRRSGRHRRRPGARRPGTLLGAHHAVTLAALGRAAAGGPARR